MKLTSLSTLFTNTINNFAALKPEVDFRGSEINTFQFEGLEPLQDRFTSNPLIVQRSKAEIEQMAKSNPRIMALLNEYNIPLKVNMDVLEEMR